MKVLFISFLAFLLYACTPVDPYDPAAYQKMIEENDILPQIISYTYTAPPYTSMKDRFKPEHTSYYRSVADKFSLYRYFIADNQTHYFYLIRTGAKGGDKRAVAGHFRLDDKKRITGFREVFVTPILPEADLKDRCLFLFDEMIKGTIEPFLIMPTYVQWPNPASFYDTTTYEWRFLPAP